MGACGQSKSCRSPPSKETKQSMNEGARRPRQHLETPASPSLQSPYGIKVRRPPVEAVELLRSVLSAQPLFQGSLYVLVAELLSIAQLYKAPSNAQVFTKGDTSEYIYCVYSGVLVMLSTERVELRPGALYGLIDLFQHSIHSSSSKSSDELLYWAISRSECLFRVKQARMDRHNRLRSFLENSPMFKLLATEQLDSVVDSLKETHYSEKTKILVEGQQGSTFYFILSGSVEFFKQNRLIRSLTDGEYFGEKSVLFDIPRTATAVATPDTYLLEFSKDNLQAIFGENLAASLYRGRLQAALMNSQTLKYLLPEKLQLIAEVTQVQQYEAKEVVIPRSTVQGSGVWAVLNGGLFRPSDAQTFEQATLIGEADLLNGSTEPVSKIVKAATDCEVGFLSRESLEGIVGKPLSERLSKYRLITALKQARPLQILHYADLETIADHAVIHKFDPKQVLFEAGEYGEELWVICKGKVNIVKEEHTLRTISDLGSFGYHTLLSGEARTASAVTATGTTCWTIHKQFLHALFEPSVMKYMRNRLQFHDKSTSLENLRLIKPLPSKGLSTVMIVADICKQKSFVLKSIPRSSVVDPGVAKSVNAKRNIMLEVDHPMAASLVKAWKDQERVYFLMEHVQGTDLFEINDRLQQVPETVARFYTACLVLVLEHLHTKSIVFRDLKPEEIAIDSKGYPKLLNFRTAKIIRGRTSTIIGTPQFMAPEILQGKSYGTEADLWSLGVVLHEMLVGRLPFGHNCKNPFQICEKIIENQLELPERLSPSCQQLMRQLMSLEPFKRKNCHELKLHPWLETVEWHALLLKNKLGPYTTPKTVKKSDVLEACASKQDLRTAIENLEMKEVSSPGLNRQLSREVRWDSIF